MYMYFISLKYTEMFFSGVIFSVPRYPDTADEVPYPDKDPAQYPDAFHLSVNILPSFPYRIPYYQVINDLPVIIFEVPHVHKVDVTLSSSKPITTGNKIMKRP